MYLTSTDHLPVVAEENMSQVNKLIPKKKSRIHAMTRAPKLLSDGFDFFRTAPISSASLSSSTSAQLVDAAEQELSKFLGKPNNFPMELWNNNSRRVRIHYLQTNNHQAEQAFKVIMNLYATDLVDAYSDQFGPKANPLMSEYMTNDPLGEWQHPSDDTNIWRNAVAETPDGETNEETDATGANPGVPTNFATQLAIVQDKFYKTMRANMPNFMCEQCVSLMEAKIRKHDQEVAERGDDNEGVKKLRQGMRYKWKKYMTSVQTRLCVIALGSFHFLPLFTTMREDNTDLATWCSVIRSINQGIESHKHGWDAIANLESCWLLYRFMSPKEIE